MLTPYSGLSITGENSCHYRLGGRLKIDDLMTMSLEIGRREVVGREDDHGVMLQVQVSP